MTTPEKKKKKKKLLANRQLFKAQQKKKSISITEKPNLFNQITIISNGDEKFNRQQKKKKKKKMKSDQICKGKSISSNNSTKQMLTHLQDEIVMDILDRLPVRTLHRFKCVSKTWKSLISDPYFKMKHLNRAKNDQNSQKLLISQRCQKDGKYNMYCLNLSSDRPVENVQKLEFPLITRPYICSITCSCDGLVIMMVNENFKGGEDTYLLWNPSTGESIVLPDAQLSPNQSGRMGLCYDSTSGDYMILNIHCDIDSPGEILSLKSGSWRNIDKHPRGICSHYMGMHYLPFVNEAFHWIGIFGKYSKDSRNYSVVSFSISNEVYGDIPLPQQLLCLKGYIYIGVSVLDGMLCACSTSDLPTKGTFKLWVLKDYGVKEYWTSLLNIEDPCISYMAIPKYRFADGELLYWFLSFDQEKGNAFRTRNGPFGLWPRCDTLQDGIVFTESLISPKSLI